MESEDKICCDKVEEKYCSTSTLPVNAVLESVDVSELLNFCGDLNLPEDVQKKAVSITQSLYSHKDELKGVSRAEMTLCGVYMALIDARMPYGPLDPQLQCGYIEQPAVTITEFLTNMGGNVPMLIKTMHRVRDVMKLSDAVMFHLKCFEKKYCIVSALTRPFQKLCCRVFTEDPKDEAALLSPKESVDIRMTLCWTVFVHAKSHLLTDEQIVDAFYILMCCLEYVLRTTPAFQLNSPFNAVEVDKVNGCDEGQSSMLRTLAKEFTLSFEEVKAVQENRTEPFIRSLPHENGELDLKKLTELYIDKYKQEGDINELLFLQQDPHLLPADQHSEKLLIFGGKTEAFMTPIRAALNTVQKLKSILSTAQDEPGKNLQVFFENCSTQNPAADIAARVRQHREKFIRSYIDLAGKNHETVAEQRFTLAQRLYYRVMDTMLQTEKERLSRTDFSQLLNIDAFHKSLLACSVEIVLMTYGVSWDPSIGAMGSDDSKFSFPWILEVFDIQPYNFSKVLESFIRAEPVLTKDIVQYLQSLEIKILESQAWKSDSPLFEVLAEDMPNTEIMTVTDLTNGLSASSADLYLSPMRPPKKKPVIPSPRKSQVTSAPVTGSPERSDSTRRSQSLTLFLNKVSRLGYNRLQSLCGLLDVPKDLQHKIWTCFEHCITKKPALLKNRHLDQVMLCSLYGICKVVDKEIKFKAIVERYRDMPHSEPHIYKSALITGREFDSIIVFYNKVFMHNMKNFILQFSTNKQTMPTLSPVPKTKNSPLISPVYSIPSRRGFYVSPLKDSPFKPPPSPSQMTPRTRQLYSFGEGLGSSEKLKQINETVSRLKHQSVTPGRKKRLQFDQIDDASNSASVIENCSSVNIKKPKLALSSTKEDTMDVSEREDK